MKSSFTRFAAALFVLILFCAVCPDAEAQSGTASRIPATDLLQPAELAQILQSSNSDSKKEKPLVLQVGSLLMFTQAHIPGAEFAGAGGKEEGLRALKERASKLDRGQFVVLYCGCCPWGRCPNIWPAYQQMRSLGFTNLKVLYIADNFGADWVDKGYPVTKGQ